MKKKYFHQKLIRDRIPELIKASGDDFETRVMDITEYRKEIKRKLTEEAQEVIEASDSSLINELADVLEIIKSIASEYKINFREVEKYSAEKRKKRGGFRKKLFLVWSTGKPGK